MPAATPTATPDLVLDLTAWTALRQRLREAAARQPALADTVAVVERPLRHLRALGALAPDVLRGDSVAMESFLLLLGAAKSGELAFRTAGVVLNGTANDTGAYVRAGVVGLGGLIVVGLAALRADGAESSVRQSLNTVQALARAAAPAEMIHRRGSDELPDAALDAYLEGLFPLADDLLGRVFPAVAGFVLDPWERARWRQLDWVFGASGLGLLLPPESEDSSTASPVPGGPLLLPSFTDRERPMRWPSTGVEVLAVTNATAWPGQILGVVARLTQALLAAPDALEAIFAAPRRPPLVAPAELQPAAAGAVAGQGAHRLAATVPEGARSGWIGISDPEALDATNADRERLRADLAAANKNDPWLALAPVPLEPLAELHRPALPRRNGRNLYRGGTPQVVGTWLEAPAAPGGPPRLRWTTLDSEVARVQFQPDGAGDAWTDLSEGEGQPPAGELDLSESPAGASTWYRVVPSRIDPSTGALRDGPAGAPVERLEPPDLGDGGPIPRVDPVVDLEIVLVRPVVPVAGPDGWLEDRVSDEQIGALLTLGARHGLRLRALEPPVLSDALAALDGPLTGADQTGVHTLVQALARLAIHTPGLEHAAFVALVPGRPDWGLARSFEAAASLVVGTPRGALVALATAAHTGTLPPQLGPPTTRLRLTGWYCGGDDLTLDWAREDRRAIGPSEPADTGLRVVALGEAGQELGSAPLRRLLPGLPALVYALPAVSGAVRGVEIRREQRAFQLFKQMATVSRALPPTANDERRLRRLERRDHGPLAESAKATPNDGANGLPSAAFRLDWTFDHPEAARLYYALEVGFTSKRGDLWFPLQCGSTGVNEVVHWQRSRLADRLRIVASDGWNTSELGVPAETTPARGRASAIRRVRPGLWWADAAWPAEHDELQWRLDGQVAGAGAFLELPTTVEGWLELFAVAEADTGPPPLLLDVRRLTGTP